MADYISTLTGVQMDAALIDMAEHNSEAYAVGERNGIPVGSGDVTYENNARYYASQAQSIAPASVTEAVRWDIAQTALTDAQRLQGRENIKATSHNYNLLDNSWFLVNQRSAGTISSNSTYGADRWVSVSGTNTFSNSGVAIGTSTANIQQRGVSLTTGETYTFSALLSNGTIYSGTKTIADGNSTTTFLSNSVLELDYFGGQSPKNIRVYNTGSSVLNIRAVKLELGSFSTLANDTPPDYGTELAKCRYYFRRIQVTSAVGIGLAYASSTTRADWLDYTQGTPMRPTSSPTVTFSGTINLYNGSNHAVSSVYAIANGTQYNLRLDTTGLTANQPIMVSAGGAAYIDISHDL